MLESYGRDFYQKMCVNPMLLLLRHWPVVTPVKVTLLAAILGALSAVCLMHDWVWLAVSLLLLSGYMDTLDGSLARDQGCSSPRGAVLDILSDRFVEFMIILALYWQYPEQRALGCLLMMGANYLCVASFLAVGLFIQNQSHKSFHYSVGLMERAEAFVFFIALMLLPKAFMGLAVSYSILVSYTAVSRVFLFYRQV